MWSFKTGGLTAVVSQDRFAVTQTHNESDKNLSVFNLSLKDSSTPVNYIYHSKYIFPDKSRIRYYIYM